MSGLKRFFIVTIILSLFVADYQFIIPLWAGKTNSAKAADTTTPPASTPDPWADIKILPPNETFASDKYFVFLLESPDEAYIGDVIPLSVFFHVPDTAKDEHGETISNSQTNVDMVRLSITDPSRGNIEHLKDAYINLDNRKSVEFTYSWDTLASATRASTSDNHKITAYAYQKFQDGYVLTGEISRSLKMHAMPTLNIRDHGLWGAYLDETRAKPLSEYWKKKLGCGSDDCKYNEDIEAKMKSAIESGDFAGKWVDSDYIYNENEKFNKKDIDDLFYYANNYLARLRVSAPNPTEKDGETFGEVFAYTTLIIQMLGVIEESVSGEATPQTEEMLKCPQYNAVNEVANKYLTKIASYNPQSEEELKKLPIWSKMEEDLKAIYETDLEGDGGADDTFTDEELQQFFATNKDTTNPLKPEKAEAILPILAALYVGGIIWSAYDAYKEPNAFNVGMLAVSVIPGGALGKLGKLPKIGKFAISGISNGVKAVRAAGSVKAAFKLAVGAGAAALKGSKAWLGTANGVKKFTTLLTLGYRAGGVGGAAKVLGGGVLKGLGYLMRVGSKKALMVAAAGLILGVLAVKLANLADACKKGWTEYLNPVELIKSAFCSLAVLIKEWADGLMCFAKNLLIKSLGYASVPMLPQRCTTNKAPEEFN